MSLCIVKQAKSGPVKFMGLNLPHGAVYGCVNGYEFVSEPIQENPHIIWRPITLDGYAFLRKNGLQKSKKDPTPAAKADWKTEQNSMIQAMILGAMSGKVAFYRADAGSSWCVDQAEQDARNRTHELCVSEAKNQSVIRRVKVQTKHRMAQEGADYVKHSRKLYGSKIEFNGKFRRMTASIAHYMDGNTFEGYRPLNPQFPVKSGKR